MSLENFKNHIVFRADSCFPMYGRKYTVGTDANNMGLGVILLQVKDGEEKVFFSERHSQRQKKLLYN